MALLKSEHPEAHARLRAAVPTESWEAVEKAPRMAWVLARHEREFVNRWAVVLEEDVALDFLTRAILLTVEGPLFSAILSGAIRMFGMTPAGPLKMLTRSWPHIYRDHLELKVNLGDERRAEVIFDDIAPEVFECRGYERVWRSIFLAILQVCEVQGKVRLERSERVRRIVWTIDWLEP